MPSLILVKHSQPQIDPGSPASDWPLSAIGRRRCEPLADRLAIYRPDAIVSSRERKAIETAQIVAGRLNLPCTIVDDLHEHVRNRVAYLGAEQFEVAVASFFAQPDRLVFGAETADEAHSRFARAVSNVLQARPDRSLAIVAHGTVIALFVSRLAGFDPFPFWQALDLPSFVVLALPELRLQEVVASVAR